MKTAMIALGSNIEPRDQYLSEAVHLLNQHEKIKVVNQSSIYETEPVGYQDQQSFLNMVIKVETDLSPIDLLYGCQQIEASLGREREIRWGPRTVDLDILVYNQESVDLQQLKIPHPRMHERAFVLIPLAEIGGEIIINGHTVNYYTDRLTDQDHKGVTQWSQKDGD